MQIRVSVSNEKGVAQLVNDARSDFMTVSKVTNLAIEKGLPIVRKLLVSPRKSRKP